MEQWFAGLPEVSDTQIGAWGVSYGGGQTWDGLAAGIPYKAAEVVETWTDLYSALWPRNVAKSGIVAGFAKSVDARSPLITSIENDAVRSTNLGRDQGARRRTLGRARAAVDHHSRLHVPRTCRLRVRRDARH